MLKGILFFLKPETSESPSVQKLLQILDTAELHYTLVPSLISAASFSEAADTLSLPYENCLIITDSASCIAFAHKAAVPCIGYAPPEGCENLSGAYALFEDFASIDVAYLCRTHAHAVGYPADIFTTERLTIREFSDEDFPTLYAICIEPSTAFFMEETLSDYETEQKKHIAYIRNVYPIFDLALWGVYEKNSGKLIGRAGFSLPADNDLTFSVGYLIDVPYRRCGYAKELIPSLLFYAKEQGYSEISARIKQENIASVKALEQCGYPYECMEKDDVLIYSIHLQ